MAFNFGEMLVREMSIMEYQGSPMLRQEWSNPQRFQYATSQRIIQHHQSQVLQQAGVKKQLPFKKARQAN